jgi:hypothetical protein
VPAFPLTRILIITDAWLPQVNGVVRSIEALMREAPPFGVEIEILAADGFRRYHFRVIRKCVSL